MSFLAIKSNGWAYSAPSGWDRNNVSENLGKAAALPALPLITPLHCAESLCRIIAECRITAESYWSSCMVIMHGDYAQWLCTVILHGDSAQWSSCKVIRVRIFKQNHSAESQCRITVQNHCAGWSVWSCTVPCLS